MLLSTTRSLTMAVLSTALLIGLNACQQPNPKPQTEGDDAANFVWNPERFADINIIRYRLDGFDRLSLQQKKLVYYLVEAGLCGRDITWAQNYRHNLAIRHAIEAILNRYSGDRNSEQFNKFLVYAKRVFMANGIHHHYSNDKFIPDFDRAYFESLLANVQHTLSDEVLTAMFDPNVDAKKVSLDPTKDLVEASAVNFYGPGVTEKDVDNYYKALYKTAGPNAPSFGLNSRLVKQGSQLVEQVYSANGLYGAAIRNIVKNLRLAAGAAENEQQAKTINLLADYYETGDLKKWDEFNIAWVNTTQGDIDFIHGFVEVYDDPKGYKGSYEAIVQIKDFEASERMKVVSDNAQWFEDNSPILPQHKKKNVVGITYKVVTVAGEAGDASPSTPIGVNLPNAEWIREQHGSKSVSLGNIIEAYDKAQGAGLMKEFAFDATIADRIKQHGSLANKMSTALHEVIGHASGQLEPGVGIPAVTLKNYASAMEETRADLVALYYIADPKIQALQLVPSDEVAKAEYDYFILNGLMLQLRRIEPGKDIEEAHMRNRQLIAKWAYEMGKKDNVIERIVRDGKTYFRINDYAKLRQIFGEQLREIQRIKSQGDYQACRNLFETYGVKVEADLHREVLERAKPSTSPPYGGFINPRLVAITNSAGDITDIKVEYVPDFLTQMLEYGKKYAFLPATD